MNDRQFPEPPPKQHDPNWRSRAGAEAPTAQKGWRSVNTPPESGKTHWLAYLAPSGQPTAAEALWTDGSVMERGWYIQSRRNEVGRLADHLLLGWMPLPEPPHAKV